MNYILKLLCVFLFPVFVATSAEIVEQDPQHVILPNIQDINGEEFNFEKLEDNVLILHFWATWCSGCSKEMETLNQLQKILRKDRVIILPISEDFKGDTVVRSFYKAYNLSNLPAFIDRKQQLFHNLGVISLPTTFVLDSEGRVVAYAKGPVDWLEEKNINLLKHYVMKKHKYNKDYVDLLNKQKIFEKPRKEVQNSSDTGIVPVEAETKLEFNPNSDIKRGEIRFTNSRGEKASLKIRRPVNKFIESKNGKS